MPVRALENVLYWADGGSPPQPFYAHSSGKGSWIRMLTLPRFHFHRTSVATADDKAVAGGALTDVPLSNVRRLCLPPLRASDGILR
ncbi:MAG TPA: hypothetical protein PLR69_02600, partial [Candidatus Limiplasma sp.]|nr:hypothetical protein [Candidatus Limiplasma sp.]